MRLVAWHFPTSINPGGNGRRYRSLFQCRLRYHSLPTVAHVSFNSRCISAPSPPAPPSALCRQRVQECFFFYDGSLYWVTDWSSGEPRNVSCGSYLRPAHCLEYDDPGGWATTSLPPRWDKLSSARCVHPSAACAEDNINTAWSVFRLEHGELFISRRRRHNDADVSTADVAQTDAAQAGRCLT